MRSEALTTALNAVGGPSASEDLRRQVIAGVIGPPPKGSLTALWLLLISGLLVLLGGLLGTIVYLFVTGAGNADQLITLFTTVLAGLIGLFAPSPLK